MKKTEPKKKAAPAKAPKKAAKKKARDEWEEIDASEGFAVSMEYEGED